MMLWTEKYRPNTLAEIVGQESFKLDAENWIGLKDMPNLLLYGTAGVGKTAAAIALSKDMLGEMFDVNFMMIENWRL